MAVAMYVFSLKSLYKEESAIFQLKFYHVKDNFFLFEETKGAIIKMSIFA
jgi:hypothetical protein